jgi:hypothetical protein
MSKEQFVNMVMGRLSSEYAKSLRELDQHRARVEEAYDTEGSATEDELDALFSGSDAVEARKLALKYPRLNEVSLMIVAELEEDHGDDEDDEDEDDEDEDDEESEDDEDDAEEEDDDGDED